MEKAFSIEEIDAVVDRFAPITPDHPFYINFEGLRGDFQERQIMKILNVSTKNNVYEFTNPRNFENKTLLFLAGMRGSGKTSELAKYAQKLHHPTCFFVVTCNIDKDLDMDRVEYMDILIFQLEQLLLQIEKIDLGLDTSILESMSVWFQENVKEINKKLEVSGEAELSISTERFSPTGIFMKLLGLTGSIKTGLKGSAERASSIRTVVRNRFGEFAGRFNTFIEQVNEQLRQEKKANAILFIIDGLEKTMSTDTRRKIIMEESNRIRQIRANTIFTLPIELMKEQQRIQNFAEIVSFPFIKLLERGGQKIPTAYERFHQLIEKRIDLNLFESEATITKIIEYSGGSPRQLLHIIERACWSAETDKIRTQDVEKAATKLGTEMARFLTEDAFNLLKQLKKDVEENVETTYDDLLQTLLEQGIVLEYNDFTYKRVNPLVELSRLYQQKVN